MELGMLLLWILTVFPVIASGNNGAAVGVGRKSRLSTRQTRLEMIKNITFLLNNVLRGYDNKIRPYMNVHPARVVIDVDVRSMGPISETDMSYSMDCYFRQTWKDERLKFTSGTHKTLVLGISMLDKIWKPDTYFWNGKRSYLHKLTTPNKFVRLTQDGTVYFSSRLTVKAKCPMDLHRFPLDLQVCPLIIGSFAYGSDEVEYQWKYVPRPVKAAENMQMSQFELTDIFVQNMTNPLRGSEYSSLEVHFHLQRHMGYFLINFYAPSTLIVVLSWVAFLINREATADRIALGFTCVLTMTFIALDSRSDLPRVTYPTALDVYILICYAFLFCCIIEFALVHSFTKFSTGDPEMKKYERQRIRGIPPKLLIAHHFRRKIPKNSDVAYPGNGGVRFKSQTTPSPPIRRRSGVVTGRSLGSGDLSLISSPKSKTDSTVSDRRESMGMRLYHSWMHYGKKCDPLDTEVNSISRIDQVARVVFPVSFTLLSLLYWNAYINGPENL